MTRIIDGKQTAEKIKERIARETEELVARGGKRPCLAAILVGSDGASRTYVGHKERACAQVGFDSRVVRLEETVTEAHLLEKIAEINRDPAVDGLIVQLPLPAHIDESKIIEAIDPAKDVDGFHPVNAGKMTLGLPGFLPATPSGILDLLEEYGIETRGRHCVVLGRSNIVGRPMANLLSRKSERGDCTVTVCHSRTPNVADYTRQADIVVAAIGIPRYLKGDMVKEGAVVIDVGITRVPDSTRKSGYRLTGDVDYETVAPKCSYITPVPGGVGPMTIVSLLSNTLLAARNHARAK